MNELDRQLAELAILHKEANSSYGSNKKMGPAVPPKPKKPQPQVPKSYPLKQQLEPCYASRIQNTYSNIGHQNDLRGHTYSNGPSPQVPTNYSSNYANLQNPSPVNSTYSNSSSIYQPTNPNQHQISTQMLPRSFTKPSQVTYSNLQNLGAQERNPDGLIYSNVVHSRSTMYSNLPPAPGGPHYSNGEEMPPPPPPLEMQGGLGDYQPVTVNTNLPPPPEDLLPPSSPVSSSYSELRRATQPETDFNNYSMGSQASSTYESIYEPINPRPPSQMSSRSNYSLYAPYVSGSTLTGPSQSASRIGLNKEQEVDNLTDLLVQGMGHEVDSEDVYGACVKCGEKIVGENSGCTAMDQLYHTNCFKCYHCAINLQGKPFYALEGHPYCEEDYLNTLEKCCVCQKPILDRILRATGKPYHPSCFCCVVCGKSLDGIPFTVDATNQVHCIEDFHKIFAPKCWVCKQPIMPEPGQEETVRVVALDHSFHIQCYKCEDCGLILSSEAEGRGCYPLDGHVLCKSCNAKRVQALTNHMTTEL